MFQTLTFLISLAELLPVAFYFSLCLFVSRFMFFYQFITSSLNKKNEYFIHENQLFITEVQSYEE